jgi:hypothetical protein
VLGDDNNGNYHHLKIGNRRRKMQNSFILRVVQVSWKNYSSEERITPKNLKTFQNLQERRRNQNERTGFLWIVSPFATQECRISCGYLLKKLPSESASVGSTDVKKMQINYKMNFRALFPIPKRRIFKINVCP